MAVCPAYAGIDPRFVGVRRCAECLPRVRGDRPERLRPSIIVCRSAPRTRGSTSRSLRTRSPATVCPAYAGIDRSSLRLTSRCHGLPRVRGDRPQSAWCRPPAPKSAPRTRGSTKMTGHDWAPWAVCPAYAGIDPGRCGSCAITQGLPRVRGDRPASCWLMTDCKLPYNLRRSSH